MSSVFTQVRNRSLPGEVLYEDSRVFAILSIAPHSPGHLLVIPVEEYTDMLHTPEQIRTRLYQVAHQFMSILAELYEPPRVALVSAGLEVDHTHLHVFSLFQNAALDHDAIIDMTEPERTIEAERIRNHLKENPIT